MIEALQAEFRVADVEGVRRELAALDPAGLADARRWAKGLPRFPWAGYEGVGTGRDLYHRMFLTHAVLLFTLTTARQALPKLCWWLDRDTETLLAEVLARPADWRADFVVTAGTMPLRASWRAASPWTVYPIVREVCRRDGLDVPWNEFLVRGWLAICFPHSWGERSRKVPDAEAARELVREDGHLEAVPLAFHQTRLSEYASFGPAVVALVEGGDVPRDEAIGWSLGALDSPGRPSDQAMMAEILVGLDLRADEVPGGLTRLQQLLATCHGSVTSRLLPMALELLATETDVEELSATIAARPEKKQRTDLLRALSTDVRARLGDDAVRVGVAILAESPDAALSTKAAAALAQLGGAAPSPAPVAARLGLWDRRLPDSRPPNDRFHELQTFDDNAVNVVMHAARNHPRWHLLEPFYEPTALSIVVRWAWRDGAEAVRTRLAAAGPIETRGYDDTSLGLALPDWIDGSIHSDEPPGWWTGFWSRTGYPPRPSHPEPEFAKRHVTESLRRAGRVPFLLSTPSRPNGGLDLDVLVDRLRKSAGVGFGPLDLLQAILRLRPTDPDQAVLLDGLDAVPPDASAGTTTDVPDAVAYVRDLVAAGRVLPPLITPRRLEDEGWLVERPPPAMWLAMLPVDPEELGSSLDELAPAERTQFRATDHRHVTPWCPDLALRPLGLWQPTSAWSPFPRSLLHSAGPLGVAVQDALLHDYAGDRPETAREAVERTLEALGRRTYPPVTAVAAAAGRLAMRRLNLSRCAAAWEQVFLAGGLYPVWNVALHTAELAVAQTRRPPGLADLLRMLTAYAGEVPRESGHREVPPRLAAYATERGTTKGHAEARRLVAALRDA